MLQSPHPMSASVPMDLPIELPEQRRITVAEFQRMVDTGVIDEDEPVELIEGVLVAMPPIGVDHSWSVEELIHFISRALPDGYRVRPSLPVVLGKYSQPEPDLAVVRAQDRSQPKRHPETALLLIEVSASSLRYDRNVKGPVYARAGIPEYWIIDVDGRAVEVRKDPDPVSATYRSVERLIETEVLRAAFAPLPPIAVKDVLP